MEKLFDILLTTRTNIIKELEAVSAEEAFQIPQGFNNNMVWNALHVMATQQVLMYGASGTPFRISESMVTKYKKGTVPDSQVDLEMLSFAKENLILHAANAKADYENGVFGPYHPLTTTYGVTLNTIEDVIAFVNVHEAMHFGQIKMLRKLVSA